MLEVIEYGKGEYEFPALVVLGCFDAIHAGHRELLKKAKLQAKINGLDLGVMMFRGGKGGKLVYSFEERCAILESYNVKFVVAVDFTDEFKAVAPLDFLHEVEEKVNVKAYMSGKDFRFGAGAKGKSSTLKNYAEDEENGVWYMSVKDVDLKGEKISTTLIKSCLDQGNVAKANELLGAEFSVSGEVVKGEGRGTSVVGFPTVNIVYPEWKHALKHGVYSVKCMVGDTDFQGIANFGNCPTFGDERIALEVYLEGYSGDLYGQVLTIRFIDFIREIEEFGSAEELSGQLQNDLQAVGEELAVTEEAPVAVVEEVTVVEEVVEEPAAAEETVAEEVEEEQPAETVDEVVEEEQPVDTVEEVVEEEQPIEVVEEAVEDEQPIEVVEEAVEDEQPIEIVEEVIEEGFDDFADDGFEDSIEEVVEETVTEEVAEEPATAEETVAEEFVEEEQSVETVEEVVEEEQLVETVEEVVEEQVEETEETVEEALPETNDAEEVVYTEGEETAVSDELAEEEPAETVEEPVEVVTEEPVEEVVEEQPAETIEEVEEEPTETIEEVTEEEQPAEIADDCDGEEN